MNSILDALQDGRLIELPDISKERALEVLSILVEAVPEAGGFDLVAEVLRRETEFNTSLGHGVACPHARIPGDGPLLCAVGWAPKGIDYGAQDGEPVHLIVLFCIPEARKSIYLKEVSSMARAITQEKGIQPFQNLTDLSDVRARLLDWVEMSVEESRSDSRARMIRLEERAVRPLAPAGRVSVMLVNLLVIDGDRVIALGDNEALGRAIEGYAGLANTVRTQPVFQCGDYEIHILSTKHLSQGRLLCDCVAVRIAHGQI